MQKIDIFWITQSLVCLETFLYYQSGNFWRFRGNFGKKKDTATMPEANVHVYKISVHLCSKENIHAHF